MNEKLNLFTQKLLEWNKIHNLSGAKTPQEVHENIEDSLYPLKFLKSTPKKALDIGTGAGFPGLILAIAMPNTEWVLSEPRKKRASFLNYIKALLELQNVKIETKRVEELPPFGSDLITSRAVMEAPSLVELAKPFITPKTTLLFYKGQNALKEAQNLQGFISQIEKKGKRHYLIIRKEDDS